MRKLLFLSVIILVAPHLCCAQSQNQVLEDTTSNADARVSLAVGTPGSKNAPGTVLRNPNDPPPAGGYFPSSITPCNVNADADTSPNAADHTFPIFQFPPIGLPLFIVQNGVGGHGQIRVLAFNGASIIAKRSLPSDPLASIGTYPGKSFRYRSELCVSGAWKPITASVVSGQASHNGSAEFWTETYGTELVRPAAENILFSFSWRWVPPSFPALHLEAKHKCEGLSGVASVATNYATASINFPSGYQDSQNLVARIGVTMQYDPNVVASGPGLDSGGFGEQVGSPPSNPFNDFIGTVFGIGPPGAGGPSGESGGVSTFPYGSPISKTLSNASSVEVNDQIRAVFIGVCNGFTATGTVVFADGRAIYSRLHSK